MNLELEGYRVLEAERAEEVLTVLDREDIAVLLLDVRLGKDDGRALARTLRDERRDLAVALVTGLPVGKEDRGLTRAVIKKPFSLEQLIGTVRALAAPAACGP